MFLWSLVSAVLIAASPADKGPPLPFVFRNVFAGECPTYGNKWVARETLQVRKKPSGSGPVAFKIPSGESFVAETGNVVTLKLGVVQVTEPTQFRPILDTGKYGPVETAQKGDRLYLLRWNGEGTYDVWFKGKVLSDVRPFWIEETESRMISPPNPTGVVESFPETRWYVQVKDARGRTGWIDMEGAKIDGVDGCG